MVRWKIETGRRKSYKIRRGPYFYFFLIFFFCFSLFKTTEISFGSTKIGILDQEKAFCTGEKTRKNDFAPSEKYSSYAVIMRTKCHTNIKQTASKLHLKAKNYSSPTPWFCHATSHIMDRAFTSFELQDKNQQNDIHPLKTDWCFYLYAMTLYLGWMCHSLWITNFKKIGHISFIHLWFILSLSKITNNMKDVSFEIFSLVGM